MRKSLVSLLAAVLLLFAFTAGVMAETTASILVTPETETFTISVPVAAGDRTVSGAQIYFELSDNLTFDSVELENVPKGFSIVDDHNTVGFFYMSTKTYSGDDGKYLITFKFSDDQPGEVIFTERKYVTDLGGGNVDSAKEQEYLKVTVNRKEPAPSEPSSETTSSAPASSAPASSNATSSQPSGSSSGTTSAPVSSNVVTSQPSASGTTSAPNRFEVQLPEQTRPASSEPAAPTPGDPAGSQPGAPTVSAPTGSEPTVSDPTVGPGSPSDEKSGSWWIVVAVIAVLAAAGGGFWFWLRKQDPEED